MILVQETTVWETATPNHVYLLSDDKSKIHGYIKQGTKELTMFKKAFPFDKRYRKFTTLKTNLKQV